MCSHAFGAMRAFLLSEKRRFPSKGGWAAGRTSGSYRNGNTSGDCPCWGRSPPRCRRAALPCTRNVDAARQGMEYCQVLVPWVGTTYLLSRALTLNEI